MIILGIDTSLRSSGYGVLSVEGSRMRALEAMGIPDHLTYLLRNLYAGQEATVRTGHGTTPGSKSGKEHIKAVYCELLFLFGTSPLFRVQF